MNIEATLRLLLERQAVVRFQKSPDGYASRITVSVPHPDREYAHSGDVWNRDLALSKVPLLTLMLSDITEKLVKAATEPASNVEPAVDPPAAVSADAMPFGPDATREEHLAWCKARALEYVDAGDVEQAFTSMVSDMRKHPQTAEHAALELFTSLHFGGHLTTQTAMRWFIKGFN